MQFAANALIVLVFLIIIAVPVALYACFAFGDRSFSSGYSATDKSTLPCIRKTYLDVTVKFYTWGAVTDSALEGKSYVQADGVYATIAAPRKILLKYSGHLFDEVDTDTEKGFIITAKKRGVFMGEPPMHEFLAKFDELFRKDLSNQG
jgi:hypothetical protein